MVQFLKNWIGLDKSSARVKLDQEEGKKFLVRINDNKVKEEQKHYLGSFHFIFK